tara:strand:+ start:253 stop:567 length:315 start_codon:yes stop_codon:yes gene_type:complete
MNKEYNLIRYEIDTTYNEYNELFIDRLLYEMDVEGLLFKYIPYGGWCLYLLKDIKYNLDRKIKIEFKKSEQRLSFIKVSYNRDSLINDNDIILLIGDQIRKKII